LLVYFTGMKHLNQTVLILLANAGVLVFLALAGSLAVLAATPVTIVYFIIAGISGSVVLLGIFGKSQWARWATLGAWPGSLIGGSLIALILLGDYRSDGWTVLIIGATVIIGGMLVSGFIGAVTGGVLGARRTCRAISTG
jgi:hypothetical protein